jgi:hypothetical protein
MQGDAHIAMNTIAQRITSELRDDSALASIVLRGNADWDSLTPQEQFRAHLWNLQEVQMHETYYSLLRQELLEAEVYEEREGHIARRIASPGTRKWWDLYSYNIQPAFRKRIEQRLANPDSLPPAMPTVPFFDPAHWRVDEDSR